MSVALQEPVRPRREQAVDSQSVSLLNLFLRATWFALIAGLTETAVLTVQRYVLHKIIYRGVGYLWMPVVGALILFMLVGVLLWAFGRLWPAIGRPRAIVAALLFLTLLSSIMVGRWIGPLSAMVLCLGVTSVVVRARRAPDIIGGLAKRTTAPLFGIWLLLAIGSWITPRALENRSIARLAAAPHGAPNIIFLILDTVRARSLSLYGYPRRTTPNIDALAKQGVVFDRAIAPAPWTLPSHASMFTGRQPYDLNAGRFRALNNRYPTLAEVLSSHGYETAGFVANLAYATREFGLARGFQHWDDYQVGLSEILANSSLWRFLLLERYAGDRNTWILRTLGVDRWFGNTRTAANVNTHLLDWMGTQRQRPFFVFANYFDAHMPYVPPKPFLGSLGPLRQRSFRQRLAEEGPGKWPRRGIRHNENAWRDRYEESIAYEDAQVGQLLDQLRRRGLLENTILVIASDHGEEFGENGHYEHDTSVDFAQTRVPLLIVAPGRVPSGIRIAAPAAMRDLGATLLQLSGNNPSALAGHSLSPLWLTGQHAGSDPVLSVLQKQHGSQMALVTDRYQYIRSANDREQLYDHVLDPDATHDLSQTAEGKAVLAQVRAQFWRATGDRAPGPAHP